MIKYYADFVDEMTEEETAVAKAIDIKRRLERGEDISSLVETDLEQPANACPHGPEVISRTTV